MANEKVIATLVGRLKFEADNRPLLAFEKRLDSVNAKMQNMFAMANKRISLKVGLDTKSLTANLKVAQQTRLVLNNMRVSKEAIAMTMAQIGKALASTPITIPSIRIPMAALTAQKKLMRDMLESTTIDLPVDVRLRQADKALRDWKARTEKRFKLYIEADISKQKFFRNVQQSIKYATARIGAMRIQTPNIKLTVDRAALRTEIQSVLRQIEREAKIRIDLTGNVKGGQRSGSSGVQPRHAMMAGGLTGAAAHAGRGFIPGLGGAFAVTQLNRMNQELQAQRLALTAVTGSEEAGAEQQKWFRQLADNLGIHERATLPSYTKMLASGTTSGFSTDEVQNIFTGISAYGRTMGLDSEAMKGTMRAIEQMMNKGQIYSEELKGQLAERAPGVISAMAEAAGFDPENDKQAIPKLFKKMEDGELMAKDVLEKFSAILLDRAKQGGALEKAMASTAAEQGRFNTAFDDMVKEFAAGGFDQGIASFFREASVAMKEATPLVRALGAGFNAAMQPVNAFMRLVGSFGALLPGLAANLGMSESGLIKFGAVALLNLTPLGRLVTLFSSLVLAAEDFSVFLRGGTSKFGEWFNQLSPDKQELLNKFGVSLRELGGALAGIAEMVFTGWSGIFGYFESGGMGWIVIDAITKLANALTNLLNSLKALSDGNYSMAGESLDKFAADGSIWNMARGNNNGNNSMSRLYDQFMGNQPNTNTQTMMRDRQIQGTSMMAPQQVQHIENLTVEFPNVTNGDEAYEVFNKRLNDMMTRTKANLLETKK